MMPSNRYSIQHIGPELVLVACGVAAVLVACGVFAVYDIVSSQERR